MECDAHVYGVGFILYLVARFSRASESKSEFCPTFFVCPFPTIQAEGHGNTSIAMKKFFVLLFGASLLSSCATVFCGSKTKVTFESAIPEKATLTIDGRKHAGITFPYTTKIKRGFDETVVKAEAPGYKTQTLIIDKTFNAVSVINLLDILGWGIDAATGAMMKPEFKFYQIDFEADGGSESK